MESLIHELRRSGPDAIRMLLVGASIAAGIAWFSDRSVATVAAWVFLTIAGLAIVHAPEDAPGGIDNPDGRLSHPVFLAAVAVLASMSACLMAWL